MTHWAWRCSTDTFKGMSCFHCQFMWINDFWRLPLTTAASSQTLSTPGISMRLQWPLVNGSQSNPTLYANKHVYHCCMYLASLTLTDRSDVNVYVCVCVCFDVCMRECGVCVSNSNTKNHYVGGHCKWPLINQCIGNLVSWVVGPSMWPRTQLCGRCKKWLWSRVPDHFTMWFWVIGSQNVSSINLSWVHTYNLELSPCDQITRSWDGR